MMSGSFVWLRGVGFRLSSFVLVMIVIIDIIDTIEIVDILLGVRDGEEQNGKRAFDFVRFFVPLQNRILTQRF